jgi:hypothetical protein
MPLTKLLYDLDKLTPEEKLKAIQHLTTSLLQKNSQVLPSTAKPGNVAAAEMPQKQSKTEIQSEQLTSNLDVSQPDNSKKNSDAKKKTYTLDHFSETSPDGTKRYVVNIPSRDMTHDYAEKMWDVLSEKQEAPSVSKQEFVYECANFIRLACEIQAKAVIRKEITGSEFPEKPAVETKKRKRKKDERPEQKMIITRIGDGHYHIDYEDIDVQEDTTANNMPTQDSTQ